MNGNSSVKSPAAKEKWLVSMAERLTCPICYEFYNDPVTLKCGHTICKDCIKRWCSSRLQGQWMCPLCNREDTVVQVESLDVNFTLKNLCQEYKDYCQNDPNTVQSEGENQTSRTQPTEYCEHHPNQLSHYICITCKESFCGTCSALERKHSDICHQVYTFDKAVQPVTEIFNEMKDRLNHLYAMVDEKNDALLQAQHDSEATVEVVNRHCTELKNKLCGVIDSQMKILLQRINNRLVNNGLYHDQLYQLYDDAFTLQTHLDPEISEQNVVSKVNAILPLLDSVKKLQQSVEHRYGQSIEAIPSFACSDDLNENMVLLIEESCGTLQQQETKNIDSQYSDQSDVPKSSVESFIYSDDAFPTINGHENGDDPNLVAVSNIENESVRDSGSHPQAKKVETRHMCSLLLPTNGINLEHVAWVGDYLLAVNMEEGCIWCVNHNSGDVKRLYKYTATLTPMSVWACRSGDTFMIAVNAMYNGVRRAVCLHKMDLKVLYVADPLAYMKHIDYVRFDVGYNSVALTPNLLCCLNVNGNMILLDSSDIVRIITIDDSRNWDQVHFHCQDGKTNLYAKDSNDNIATYNVTDYKLNHLCDYSTTVFESVSCLQTDKNGSLWVLDRIAKKLIKLNNNGQVVCTLHLNVPWMCQVHSFQFTNRSILMLAELDCDSLTSIICIRWPPVGGLSPHKSCNYTLSKLIKG